MSRSATASPGSEPPSRRVALDRLPFVAVGWLVVAVAHWVLGRIATRSLEEVWNVTMPVVRTVCWIGLTLGIWAWVELLDRKPRSWAVKIPAHLAGILVAGLIDAVCRHAVQEAFYEKPSLPLAAGIVYFLDLTVVAYVAVVVLKRVADTHDAVMRQERRQLTLRAELARAQLAYLDTQLQPHFLFNSLGAVLELAHEAPASAARMLRHLAALLRFAVHGRGQAVTLAEELEALEPYLEIQRLRFADWLTISRDATPEALRARIPRMTLQPIVENAIRHGLAGRTERGHIAIGASLERGVLHLRVSDNGVGLDTPCDIDAWGIGLRNLASRLRTLYGDSSELSLRAAPGGGAVTEVSLRPDLTPPPLGRSALDPDGIEPSPAQLPDPFRRNAYLSIAAASLVWGLCWVLLNLVWVSYFAPRPRPVTLGMITDYGLGALAWAVITPIMLAAARRNSLVSGRRWWRAAIHLVLACAFALAHVGLWQVLARSRAALWAPGYTETMWWTAMLYALLLGLSSYREITEWLRERETATVRLRAEIAEAELTSSAMRFDPENVLARLELLADMVQRDAATAERALTQMADRLRASLDTPRTLVAWTAQVPA